MEDKIKALYVRVSTDVQVDGYSIDAQIESLENYVKSQGWSDYVVYKDPGFSGKDLKRPAITRLISDCEEGKIDMVLVFKLDRLSRSQKDTLFLIEEVFNAHNVGFISIRERFDTTSPFGKAMIGVLSVFAQLERETILERTRIGLKKRAEDGYWRGGGKTPFAYDYDESSGMLKINPSRKVIFDLLKTLRLQGYSYAKLEKITGYDEAWIQGILNAKTNLGKIPYKGEVYEGRHEAIITEEEYEELRHIDELRSKNKNARHYLLSGKIICGYCGAKYRYQKWGKRIVCYCYSQQKSKPKYIKDEMCPNIRIDSYEIEDAFLNELFMMRLNKELFEHSHALLNLDVSEKLNEQIKEIQKRIDNLIQVLSEDFISDDIKKEISKLTKRRETLEKELKDLKEDVKKETISHINDLSKVWYQLTKGEQRSLILELLDKIIITNHHLDIYWNVSKS